MESFAEYTTSASTIFGDFLAVLSGTDSIESETTALSTSNSILFLMESLTTTLLSCPKIDV